MIENFFNNLVGGAGNWDSDDESSDYESSGCEDITLHNAAIEGDFETVKCLVDNGANVNEPEPYAGVTPLMYGLKGENFNVVKYLVEHGADVNAEDFSGNTVLFLCTVYVGKDFDRFFDYLLSKGAKINARNRKGETLLMRVYPEDREWFRSRGATGGGKKSGSKKMKSPKRRRSAKKRSSKKSSKRRSSKKRSRAFDDLLLAF